MFNPFTVHDGKDPGSQEEPHAVSGLRITNPPPSGSPYLQTSIHLFIHLHIPTHPHVHLSAHLPIHLSTCLLTHSSIHSVSIHPPVSHLPSHALTHWFIHPTSLAENLPSIMRVSSLQLDSKLSQVEHVIQIFKKSSSPSGLEDKVLPETLGMSLRPLPLPAASR